MFLTVLFLRKVSEETDPMIMLVSKLLDKDGFPIKEIIPQLLPVLNGDNYNKAKSLISLDTKLDDIYKFIIEIAGLDETKFRESGKKEYEEIAPFVEDTHPISSYIDQETIDNFDTTLFKNSRPHIERLLNILGFKPSNFKGIFDKIADKKFDFTIRDIIAASELPANYIFYTTSVIKYVMVDPSIKIKDFPSFFFNDDKLLNFMKNIGSYISDDKITIDEVAGLYADFLKTTAPFYKMTQGYINRTFILALDPIVKFLPVSKAAVEQKLKDIKEFLEKLKADPKGQALFQINVDTILEMINQIIEKGYIEIPAEISDVFELIKSITDTKTPTIQNFLHFVGIDYDFKEIRALFQAINDGKSDIVDAAIKTFAKTPEEVAKFKADFKSVLQDMKNKEFPKEVNQSEVDEFNKIIGMTLEQMQNLSPEEKMSMSFDVVVDLMTQVMEIGSQLSFDEKLSDLFKQMEITYDYQLYQKAVQNMIEGLESIQQFDPILTPIAIKFLKNLKSAIKQDSTIKDLIGSNEIGGILTSLHDSVVAFSNGGSFYDNFKQFNILGWKVLPWVKEFIAKDKLTVYTFVQLVRANCVESSTAFGLTDGFVKIIDHLLEKNMQISSSQVFSYIGQDLKFYQENIYPGIERVFFTVPQFIKMLTLVDLTTFFDALNEIAVQAQMGKVQFDAIGKLGSNIKTSVYPELQKGWSGDTQAGATPFSEPAKKKSKAGLIVGLIFLFIVIAAAVAFAVYWFVLRKKKDEESSVAQTMLV